MNLRKALVAAALGGAMGLPGAASAITVNGITFAEGAIFETINLFEAERFDTNKAACISPLDPAFAPGVTGCGNNNGVIDQIGEELIGIGKVTAIISGEPGNAGTEFWSDGDNGRELTVYFYNFFAESITAFSSTTNDIDENGDPITITTENVVINFSGGIVELYADSTPNFNAGLTQPNAILTATDGDLWLSFIGSALLNNFGANTGNMITLQSRATTAEGGDPLTDVGTNITGQGRLDVTGGEAEAYFDTNEFGCAGTNTGGACPDDADKTFTSSGQIPDEGFEPDRWAFLGTGEVQDVAVIPEPGTLALLGAGLMGLGMRRRKVA